MKERHTNISELFFESAIKHSQTTAIIEAERSISYEKLSKEVEITASYFISKGISNGSRVLVFVPMSIDLYRIVLALFKIGATAVFLDEWVNLKRMELCCKIAECNGFIGNFKALLLGKFSKELQKIPIHLSSKLKTVNARPPYFESHLDDTALITFTTGSSGVPKAAKRTHRFLFEQFKALAEKIDPKPDDVDMPVLPIVLLLNLGSGCTSLIAKYKPSNPSALKPSKIWKQVVKHKVNRITASPFFINQLSKYSLDQKIDTSPITKIFTGGAPVFPSEAKLFDAAFNKSKIEIVYGSTEAEPISSVSAKNLINSKFNNNEKGLWVGNLYHKTKIKIIEIKEGSLIASSDSALSELEKPPYIIGEIIVSGPHVLTEYYNNLDAFKRNKIVTSENIWHRTGDSGYLDHNGNLFLTGRCETLIFKYGNTISTFSIEDKLKSIEGIQIGTILELGNRIVAFIELKHKSLKSKTLKSIENKIPVKIDAIHFMRNIPRDPRHHSKIDYAKLKKLTPNE